MDKNGHVSSCFIAMLVSHMVFLFANVRRKSLGTHLEGSQPQADDWRKKAPKKVVL